MPRGQYERTPEYRAKMSAALRGRTITEEHRAKISASLKGREFSPETLARMKAASQGKGKGRKFTPAHRAKIAAARRGKTRPEITAAANPKWKGGVAPRRFAGWRKSIREAVIARDQVCADCGRWDNRSRCMHVHHVDLDETNHDLTNLLLLCVTCHRARHAAA